MDSAQGGGDSRPPPAELPEETPAVFPRVRALVVVVWVVLLAHFASTFVWAAPDYLTGLRDEEPGGAAPATGAHRALQSYMTPVFAQNWSIFAPSPLHVEYALRVRGVYSHARSLAPGPWIDTTAVEVRALTGHLLPAATERPSRRLAADTRTAYLALPEGARTIVLRPPPSVRDPADAGPDPWPGLRTALLDTGATPDVVDGYLSRDRALTAYATQVLRADGAVDPTPVYVQADIVRREIAPYGTGEQPAPTELLVGGRPPLVVGGQDDAAFRRTWHALRNEGPAFGTGAG